MNKKLPYEAAFGQQMNDLPLPDEAQSWEAMNELLDKDRNRSPLPFFVKYGGFMLCAIALVSGSWLLLRKNEIAKERQLARQENIKTLKQNKEANISQKAATEAEQKINTSKTTDNQTAEAASPISNAENNASATTSPSVGTAAINSRTSNDDEVAGQKSNEAVRKPAKQVPLHKTFTIEKNNGLQKLLVTQKLFKPHQTTGSLENKTTNQMNVDAGRKSDETLAEIKGKTSQNDIPVTVAKSDAKNISVKEKEKSTQEITKEIVSLDTRTKGLSDTLVTKNTDQSKTITKLPETDSTTNKLNAATTAIKTAQTKPATKGLLWSAGMSVQQQIPVGGQSAVGYSANGNQSFAADYIPGVYLRIEKRNKWFVQGEFSYSTPQSVREFTYNRKTILDSGFAKMTTTSMHLKKAYYHQLPLSFNYYVMPHWSVGIGGTYSLLHRAVAEQQVTTKNLQTQQELSLSSIVPIAGYTDSFLYKSQLHWLLQTDYQWNRFSFGLRYIRDAEPFIKYTHPNGELEEKKNWSLEFILRFRLWQSGK